MKGKNTLFVIINIIYFAFNFLVICNLPNPILFGWLPLHYLLFFGAAPVASIIWGWHYVGFFRRQKDI